MTLNIPETIRAGDSLSWTEEIEGYPPSDGWTLAFQLRGKDLPPIQFDSTPENNKHKISLTPAETKIYKPGIYYWHCFVYKGSPPNYTEKQSFTFNGQIEILPDFSTLGTQTDLRSTWRRILDGLLEAYENIAHRGYSSYTIGGRSWSKENLGELSRAIEFAEAKVAEEEIQIKLSKGIPVSNTVKVRFKRA